jgi:hypothetical protein
MYGIPNLLTQLDSMKHLLNPPYLRMFKQFDWINRIQPQNYLVKMPSCILPFSRFGLDFQAMVNPFSKYQDFWREQEEAWHQTSFQLAIVINQASKYGYNLTSLVMFLGISEIRQLRQDLSNTTQIDTLCKTLFLEHLDSIENDFSTNLLKIDDYFGENYSKIAKDLLFLFEHQKYEMILSQIFPLVDGMFQHLASLEKIYKKAMLFSEEPKTVLVRHKAEKAILKSLPIDYQLVLEARQLSAGWRATMSQGKRYRGSADVTKPAPSIPLRNYLLHVGTLPNYTQDELEKEAIQLLLWFSAFATLCASIIRRKDLYTGFKCHSCSSAQLEVVAGEHPNAFQFRCQTCDASRSIRKVCPTCKTKFKVRASGLNYYFECQGCSTQEMFYQNPNSLAHPQSGFENGVND